MTGKRLRSFVLVLFVFLLSSCTMIPMKLNPSELRDFRNALQSSSIFTIDGEQGLSYVYGSDESTTTITIIQKNDMYVLGLENSEWMYKMNKITGIITSEEYENASTVQVIAESGTVSIERLLEIVKVQEKIVNSIYSINDLFPTFKNLALKAFTVRKIRTGSEVYYLFLIKLSDILASAVIRDLILDAYGEEYLKELELQQDTEFETSVSASTDLKEFYADLSVSLDDGLTEIIYIRPLSRIYGNLSLEQ